MLRKIVISGICIICLAMFGQFTHVATLYRIPSNDMLPAYKKGEWVMVSNLKRFTYNDVVGYKASSFFGSPKAFCRIVGLAGDTIEINDGRLLRNRFIADNPQNLMFTYYIKKEQLKANTVIPQLTVKPYTKDNLIILTLSNNEYILLSYDYKLRRANLWKDRCCRPVVVPRGCCFVLGDNRDEAADSRKFGFIPLKDIVGVVMGR